MTQLNIVQVGSSTGGDAASDFFECYEEFIRLGILIDASPDLCMKIVLFTLIMP
mgnify:CR=1 FL=1